MSIKSMTGFARAEGAYEGGAWHSAERSEAGAEIRLNERALAQVMQAADRIRDLTNATPPRVDGLIAIKGVLDIVEHQEDAEQAVARTEAMMKSLEGALIALVAARAAEGTRLAATLRAQ